MAILLYDGRCGLCNRLVRFIVRHDRAEVFRFAALQSPFAAEILSSHGVNPAALDTFYVVLNQTVPDCAVPKHAVLNDASRPDPPSDDPKAEAAESLLSRSDAALFILGQLGNFWSFAGLVFGALPRPMRDWIYSVVARNRYRVFGRYDTCPVPSPDHRARFLDV